MLNNLWSDCRCVKTAVYYSDATLLLPQLAININSKTEQRKNVALSAENEPFRVFFFIAIYFSMSF